MDGSLVEVFVEHPELQTYLVYSFTKANKHLVQLRSI
jgi:hypothetical protein